MAGPGPRSGWVRLGRGAGPLVRSRSLGEGRAREGGFVHAAPPWTVPRSDRLRASGTRSGRAGRLREEGARPLRGGGDLGAAAGRGSVNAAGGAFVVAATAIPDRDVQAARDVPYLDFLRVLRPTRSPRPRLRTPPHRRPSARKAPRSHQRPTGGPFPAWGKANNRNPQFHAAIVSAFLPKFFRTRRVRPKSPRGLAKNRAYKCARMVENDGPLGRCRSSSKADNGDPSVRNANGAASNGWGVGLRRCQWQTSDPTPPPPALPGVSRGVGSGGKRRLRAGPHAPSARFSVGFQKIVWPLAGR